MNKNVIESVSIKILLDRSMKLASKVVRRLEINSDPPKKEEAPFFDYCPKFQSQYHPKNSLERVVSYLYLKEKDVQGKTFSQRRICKFDSTQKHDGPPGCRKLKIHPPTSQKLNGWQNVGGELSYEYENGWKTKVDQICIDSQHMDQIQRHFQAKEEQIKHDYKARIQYLKNYFKEIDENYKIEKSNLPESIKKFRSRYRQSREELKPYMKYKGCKFYEVLPMLRDRSDQQTLVKDFKAFQPLTDLKLKEKAKFLDDLFKHLNKHKRVTQEHSDEDEVEQAEQELADPEQVKLKRAFSQMIHQDVEAAAQEFNQEQYLFEVKDVNSFGQQIRMNKLHSIMDKMFQSHHTFNKDLQGYAYGRLKHQSVGDVSNENLSLMKNQLERERAKEMRRMSKSQQNIRASQSRLLQSALASTTASHHQFHHQYLK